MADYRELTARVRRRAGALQRQHALVPGDRVALFMKNSGDYLELLYAIWWVGAVAVPINAKLHPTEAAWIATDAQASLVFSDDGQCLAPDQLPAGRRELAAGSVVAVAHCATVQPAQPSRAMTLRAN
ncbi:AMP-binding protein [Pseudomonas vanderleydeniana]|uniref:AMP-binding protein n=1 Tax=Pseudomonas vanderleydeniana TaxID=2745495 RepID=UPI003F59B27A